MRSRRAIVCVTAAVLVVAGCSGSDDGASAPSSGSSDATTSATTTATSATADQPDTTSEVPSSSVRDTQPPVTTEPATSAPTTTELAVAVSVSELAAALEIDPAELGDGFFAAPPDDPDMAAALEQTKTATAAATEGCADLTLLTAEPDFSRVYVNAASDVVTVHVYIVEPPTEAAGAFEGIAGGVDQVAECLLAIGSAGLDTFFGDEGNATGITGGTQRLVGSIAPPAALVADDAIAFDTKTDLLGATPFTIDGTFVVFRVGGLIAVIEGGSPADASGPAERGAQLVAERLATL